MHSYAWSDELARQLSEGLLRERRVFAPVTAGDGVCRMQPVEEIAGCDCVALPRLPLKKLVLPSRDRLWSLSAEDYLPPAPAPRLAVLGVAPCDLYALAYLDQAFAEDALYRQRREKMLLLGAACSPHPSCRCPTWPAPPPFDLFLAEGRLWVGSAQGESWLSSLDVDLAVGRDEAFPEQFWKGQGPALPTDLTRRFAASAASPLWGRVAARCLSCGACSVVCPTCSCYQIIDEVTPSGQVARHRQWDNCFFRDHALVAGGHNFRPDRASRLRFRFEHKYLGFGDLRGVPSCVGCGRCAQACPVGIDLVKVLESLLAGEVEV